MNFVELAPGPYWRNIVWEVFVCKFMVWAAGVVQKLSKKGSESTIPNADRTGWFT